MSVRSGTLESWLGSGDAYIRNLRILRYAVGSTLAMAFAMGLGWQLSFLTPVLALSFLATPAPRPTLKRGILFVAAIAIACAAGLLLSRYVLPYTLVFIPFTGLVLARVFYAKTGGASPLLITWLLIAILVIPLMAMQSSALAVGVAGGIVFGAVMTVLMVWLAYGIFPDPVDLESAAVERGAAAPEPAPTKRDRVHDALISTVVVFPVMIVFYSLEFVSSLLILVFIAMLSMQPSFAKNFKAGIALIIGNVIGGVAAIIFYNLLVVMPEFVFLIVLTLFAGLVFGARVFSGKKTAPLYGMAFSTVLLVIGSVTSSTDDAGSKVYTRIVQIMLAVAYVVVAFGIIERISKRRAGAV
jgi:hypothetical protein